MEEDGGKGARDREMYIYLYRRERRGEEETYISTTLEDNWFMARSLAECKVAQSISNSVK